MTTHALSSPAPTGDPASAPAPLLEVVDLTVAAPGAGRRQPPLVQGASFTVHKGDVLCIVGSSGSGKSSLMKAVLGLYRFRSGVLRFGGRVVERPLDAAHRHLRRASQAVFQNPVASLNPHMSLLAGIAEPLSVRGVQPADRNRRAVALAGRMGLSPDVLARRPGQVSIGQCQRACLARALSTDPALLFLDEPLSALDAIVQRQVADLLTGIRREATATMVLITHDLRLVRRLGTHVVVVDRGRVVEQAPTERFFACPEHRQARALVESFHGREARRAALMRPATGLPARVVG